MASIKLPILSLAVREQRYSCHGCGNCCRDFTVQLRAEDIAKLEAQRWEEKLGGPATIDFRGVTYLRQREDGSCIFLMENGLCRIHAEYGFAEKPIACQLFPFHLTPGCGSGAAGAAMGVNFACQTVLENKGAELGTHVGELRRMLVSLPEACQAASPPMLTPKLRGSPREAQALIDQVDRWLRHADLSLPRRLDGLAWVVGSLSAAKLQNVREKRFEDLLHVLFGALPEELDHHPVDEPTSRQQRMLRQAVFARTEDPKLNIIARQSVWRTRWSQLSRSRRFKSGRGIAPRIGEGWPLDVQLPLVEDIRPAEDESQAAAISDLMTRYLRASVLGGRAWGAGYYGWPMISGSQAMLLNIACTGWLARLHAAGRCKNQIDIIDVRAALGRVDRTAGRAKWLGGAAERLRLSYLNIDDGLHRLVRAYRCTV